MADLAVEEAASDEQFGRIDILFDKPRASRSKRLSCPIYLL